MGRHIRILIGVAAFAAALGGCRRENRAEQAARQQVLLLGNGAEPKELDPGQMTAEIEYNIDTALFEGLVNIANDGETILPGVAEAWEVSPDGKTYTFHLRPDARWSNGSPVTADDFVFAFERVFTPSLLSETNMYGFPIVGAQERMEGKSVPLGVHALDARTVRVQLKFPAPYILYALAGAPFDPVPRAVVEKFGNPFRPGSAWSRTGNLVSNGAFELASWTPNQAVVVRRNPYYWDRGRVRLSEVRFFPTDNVESEERAFRAGELHLTYSLPNSKIKVYADRHDARLHITPQLDTVMITFNTARRPFDDARVRRALALATNRDEIIPAVTHGEYTPAHSLTRPGTAGYIPPRLVDFDPTAARRLLAKAGYPGGAGFPPVVLMFPSSGEALSHVAEALQAAWQRILGISVKLSSQEQKVFFDQLETKHYQAELSGFFYGIQAPETVLMLAERDSAWNNTGWSSPAFEEAFDRANHTTNVSVRRAAYDQMERCVQEGAAIVPIAFWNQAHLVSPMVRGWRDNALYAIDWRELWLDPGP